MAETENTGKSKIQSCKWPVKDSSSGNGSSTKPCGAQEKLFNVKGSGKYTGRPRETPICQKHLPNSIKEWSFDSAEPIKN